MAKQQKENAVSATKLYTARIEHTEDTLTLMFKTASRTYDTLKILIRMLIGGVMVVLALTVAMPVPVQAILIMIGTLLIVLRDFGSMYRTEDVMQKRKGNLPTMRYTFYLNEMGLTGEGKMKLKYETITRLIEDDKYLFLFQHRGSVCMIDKATLEPDNVDAFKEFIAERTGQSWKRNGSFLFITLPELLQSFKDRRAQSQEAKRARRSLKKHK